MAKKKPKKPKKPWYKRLAALFLVVALLAPISTPFSAHAEEAGEETVVKDVPKDLKGRLGKNFVLVDEAYFRTLLEAEKQNDIFQVHIAELSKDLEVHQKYIGQLNEIIANDEKHIAKLNLYIDDQEKRIQSLQPDFWD